MFSFKFCFFVYIYRKENFLHELVEMGSSCQTKCVKFPRRAGQDTWHTCTVISWEVKWSVWARQKPSVLIWWQSRSRPCKSKHVCMTFYLIFSLYWEGMPSDKNDTNYKIITNTMITKQVHLVEQVLCLWELKRVHTNISSTK